MFDVPESFVLTSYLKQTKNNVEGDFSTLKWLNWLDNDTLKFLSKSIDAFENENPDEDTIVDVTMLVEYISSFENNTVPFSNLNTDEVGEDWHIEEFWDEDPDDEEINDFSNRVESLRALVVMERFRRKGMLEFSANNSGTLSSNPEIILTKKGKKVKNIMKKLHINE